jgi:hypothetical protein
MGDVAGGTDSFEIVQRFMEGLGGRKPRPEEVQAIGAALLDIYARYQRVVKHAPRVELSDGVKELIEIARSRNDGLTWFLRAASL